jgi:4-amino-4-deoxy-L-arabinose transferase-like glycosyltransferase
VYDAAVHSRATMIGWLATVMLVICTTLPALRDPPFWDANVYVNQGRYADAHGFDIQAWRHPPDVLKPPLFAALVLGALAEVDPTPLGMHLGVLAFALALLAATRSLVRALGGDERQALVAGVLCATSPLFVAQAGLVQSDLPMTALATWAWVALVRGRVGAWLVLSALAVLTKESAYFLCAPALVLTWLGTGRSLARTARRTLVFAWPGLVLVAWLGVLHALTGHAVPRLNRDALGANFILDTAIHQLVEGGRIFLVALAVVALRGRRRAEDRDAALFATAAGVIALPLMFPAPLPRYMMPGLPLLCALAAVGLWRLGARPRAFVISALLVAQVAGWFGPSWHANGGHHLDCNLRYRTLLRSQLDALAAVAAEHPRAVVTAFPLWFALLNAGLVPVLADPSTPTPALCAADFFLDADQSAPVDDTRARVSLTPWRSFGAPGISVRVSRIDCAPGGSPRLPPAPPPSRD